LSNNNDSKRKKRKNTKATNDNTAVAVIRDMDDVHDAGMVPLPDDMYVHDTGVTGRTDDMYDNFNNAASAE